MAKWVLDQWANGPLEYPVLGFIAEPGDILDASSAPDNRWSLNANQAAAETVFRFVLGNNPDYVEPTNGHVLTWSTVQNRYVPTAPEVVGMPSLDANVADKLDNPLSAIRLTLDPYLSATIDTLAAPRGATAAQVCIVLDDIFISQYRYGVPLAERYGHKVTFAVSTVNINASSAYMKSADILDAYQRGHEMASHTVNHPDMRDLTSATRAPEFDASKTAIEAIIGAGNCKNFIYPVSSHDGGTDREGYGRYTRLFAGIYFGETTRTPAGSRVGFVHGRQTWSRINHAATLALIRDVAATRERIVIYTHRLTNTDDAAVTLAQFEEVMSLMAELGVQGVTLSTAYPDQTLIQDPQFKDATLAWWKKTAYAAGPSEANISQDTTKVLDPVVGGTTSLKIIGATGVIRYVRCAAIPVAEFAGQEVTLKFRYFIDNAATIESGGGVLAVIKDLDGNESIITPDRTGPTGTVKNAWTEYTYAFTIPAHTGTPASDRYGITIDLRNNKVIGNTWFSHVYLAPTSEGVYG